MRATKNYLDDAQQRLGVANHLLGRTYPMVNDSRILLAVAKEVHASAMSGVTALLEHDLAKRRIPALVKNIDGRLELLEESLEAHKLKKEYHATVRQLQDVMDLHEKAPVEFAKADRFVLCDKDYKLTTVTVESLKKFLSSVRGFVADVEKVVSDGHAGSTV